MLPSHSGILAEAISFAFTSLQQRPSITLFALIEFLILICNNRAAKAQVQFKKQPPEEFCKKSALENLKSFTGKRLCWSLFLINLQVFRLATLLKRDSNTGIYLPVKFAKLLRTPILKNNCERLLMQFLSHGSMFIIYVIDLSIKNKM